MTRGASGDGNVLVFCCLSISLPVFSINAVNQLKSLLLKQGKETAPVPSFSKKLSPSKVQSLTLP